MPSLARLALALCLLCGWASAAEVLPSAGKAVGVVIDDTPGSWAVVAQDFSPVESVKEFNGNENDGYLGVMFEGNAGRYLAIKSGGKKLKTFAVVLGAPAPGPTPPAPVPPSPVPPSPVPPAPVPPAPSPAPINADGFRVIFIYEQTDKLYAPVVDSMLNSTEIRAFLTARCAKDKNGQASFRYWDDDSADTDFSPDAPAYLKAAYLAAVKDKPADAVWIIVSDGKTGFVGQCPDTAAGVLELLKKYAPPASPVTPAQFPRTGFRSAAPWVEYASAP